MTSAIVKPCFIYLIYTASQGRPRSYVGWTTDIEQRLHKHNSDKGAKSTRGAQWELVYSERFLTRGAAMAAEYQLKKDRKRRQALINEYLSS